MKHSVNITVFLILLFVISQITGLIITSQYINVQKSKDSGTLVYNELPFNIERPDINESISYLYILAGVLIGTALLLVIIKFKKVGLWKFWYFIAILTALTFAFKAFLNQYIAFILALGLTLYKILKPNVYMHNLSEIFIYGGLAAIFVPIMNIYSAAILLIIISIYDMIAVWKLRHMITMAKFQSESNIFAGLFIPYKKVKLTKKPSNQQSNKTVKTAILGGGDIAFPLLFTGVYLKEIIQSGSNIFVAMSQSLIIVLFATLSLTGLFFYSKEKKFYPAMPFISIGCFIGFGILLIF